MQNYTNAKELKKLLLQHKLIDKDSFLNSVIFESHKKDVSFWEDFFIKYITMAQLDIMNILDTDPNLKNLFKSKTCPDDIGNLTLKQNYIKFLDCFKVRLTVSHKYKKYWKKALDNIKDKGYDNQIETADDYDVIIIYLI